MRKTYLVILLLSTLCIFAASSNDFSDMIFLVNEEPTYEGIVTERFDFEKEVHDVRFEYNTDTESGTLSLAWIDIQDKGGLVYSFRNMIPQSRFMDNENWWAYYSENGHYFTTIKENTIDRDKQVFNNFFRFYNHELEMQYEFTVDSLLPSNVNSLGQSFANTKDYKNIIIIEKDGNMKKLPPLIDYSKYNNSLTNYYPFLSDNGLIACLVSPIDDCAENDYFPLGSRLFFFNENLEVTSYKDLEGKMITHPYGISRTQNYIIVKSYKDRSINTEKVHIFHNEEEIMVLEGSLSYFRFSPDEKMVAINVRFDNGTGIYIVDLEKREVIAKTKGISGIFSIANKGIPVIAFSESNLVFVVNYKTNELLMKEWVGPENKRLFYSDYIQISGDGTQVSAFTRQWYKKFRIGGMK